MATVLTASVAQGCVVLVCRHRSDSGEVSIVRSGSLRRLSPLLLVTEYPKCGASAGIHTYKVNQQRGGASLRSIALRKRWWWCA